MFLPQAKSENSDGRGTLKPSITLAGKACGFTVYGKHMFIVL